MATKPRERVTVNIGDIIEDHSVRRAGDTSYVKKYKKGRYLGKGGFAKVYEMTSCDSHRTYAGKVIPKTSLLKASARRKLLNEIKIHHSLGHSNIVKFERFFEDKENVYILLELCPNNTLMELVKRRKRLTETEVQYYMWQLIKAVAHIHSHCIIHRDLKLGNLFLDKSLELKVGDLGLATRLTHPQERKRTLCGTPNYMAPEILHVDGQGHSFEVDIWAMGVIMYTLLIGRPPFETTSVKSTYRKIRANSYEFPPDIPISAPARTLIARILSASPESRPTLEQMQLDRFFSQCPFPARLPFSVLTLPLEYPHCAYPSSFELDEGLMDAIKELGITPTLDQPQSQMLASSTLPALTSRLEPTLPESSELGKKDGMDGSSQGFEKPGARVVSPPPPERAAATLAAVALQAKDLKIKSGAATVLRGRDLDDDEPEKGVEDVIEEEDEEEDDEIEEKDLRQKVPATKSRNLPGEDELIGEVENLRLRSASEGVERPLGDSSFEIKPMARVLRERSHSASGPRLHAWSQRTALERGKLKTMDFQNPKPLKSGDTKSEISRHSSNARPKVEISGSNSKENKNQLNQPSLVRSASVPSSSSPRSSASFGTGRKVYRIGKEKTDPLSPRESQLAPSSQEVDPASILVLPSDQGDIEKPGDSSPISISISDPLSAPFSVSDSISTISSTMLSTTTSSSGRSLHVLPDPSSPDLYQQHVHVNKWVDYSQRYGLGYLLSDGCAGVHFNDMSKICLSANGLHFDYIDQPGKRRRERKLYQIKGGYPSNLKKKVHLLIHFNKHLRQQQTDRDQENAAPSGLRTLPGMQDDDPTLKPPAQELVYVRKWVRTKHAIMFQLSTRTVQVIFYDESEIFLSPNTRQLTYQTQQRRQTMSLEEAANFPLISKRLVYTNQVFHHALCKSSPTSSSPSETQLRKLGSTKSTSTSEVEKVKSEIVDQVSSNTRGKQPTQQLYRTAHLRAGRAI